MKILIVEDEAKTSEYLQQGLTEAGFVVDLARNGLDGHHLAMTEQYDLIILDVMLADVDGWDRNSCYLAAVAIPLDSTVPVPAPSHTRPLLTH